MLQKIIVENFKCYEAFRLDFNEDINIIVGDNEAGKSTLLEAINLVLTARVAGRPIQSEISPHLFNQSASREYVEAVNAGSNPMQPEIIVDLFLKKDPETAHLTGTNNLDKVDSPGIRLRIAYNDEYADEYKAFIAKKAATSIPVEYYKVEWLAFSGNPITQRGIPVAASMINAANIRLQNGADYYLQKIIKGHLTDQQRTELSRAYRDLKQTFTSNPSISAINDILDQAKGDVSDKTFKLGIGRIATVRLGIRASSPSRRPAVHDDRVRRAEHHENPPGDQPTRRGISCHFDRGAREPPLVCHVEQADQQDRRQV